VVDVQRRANALGRELFDHGDSTEGVGSPLHDSTVGHLARGFDRGERTHGA